MKELHQNINNNIVIDILVELFHLIQCCITIMSLLKHVQVTHTLIYNVFHNVFSEHISFTKSCERIYLETPEKNNNSIHQI